MVVLAEGRSGTFGMAFYCVGMTSMLTASAVVHLRDWKPSQVELLVRLDHSAIFVMFAMAGTPLAWLGMQGRPGTWLLIVLWAGSAIGIAAEWIPIHPPAGFMNAAYLTFGWGTAIFLPWMIRDLDLALLVLLLAGGAAYTSGAIVVGARRPDPWPRTFGYHEVWHVAVLIACVLHLALVARLTGAI